MINKKELRIGNKVTLAHESNNPIVTVKELGEFEVAFEEKEYDIYSYDLLMPVKLTPEILEACGFIKRGDGAFINEILCIYMFAAYSTLTHLNGFQEKEPNVFTCKYLHQLQNLYHALTGSELSIIIEKLTGREAGE